MTTESVTRQIVSAFHEARAIGDFENAARHLAPDCRFQSPLMRIDDAASYLRAQAGFHPIIERFDLLSELYGEGEATLIHDLYSQTPSSPQRTAEHVRVADAKIQSILLIFDAAPWRVD